MPAFSGIDRGQWATLSHRRAAVDQAGHAAQRTDIRIADLAPRSAESGRRPLLQSEVLFRGVHGRLEADLTATNKTQAQSSPAFPTFYSLAGEEIPVPPRFEAAVRSLVNSTNCSGC